MLASLLLMSAAAGFTDTAALDAAAAAFAGAPLGAQGGPLAPIDPRLRLARCQAEPTLDWRSARRDAIVIQCPDAGGWRLFVAVRLAPAATAAMGAAVPVQRVEPVIRRGDAVAIVAEAAGFSVTTEGVAMADAPEGGRLQVRVDARRQPIQAVAIAPGRVALPGR